MVYTALGDYISPYITYHLLREPETAIDVLTVIFPLLMLFLDPVSNVGGSVQDALWASQCLLGKEHLEGFIHNDAQKWVVNESKHPTLKSSTLKPKVCW